MMSDGLTMRGAAAAAAGDAESMVVAVSVSVSAAQEAEEVVEEEGWILRKDMNPSEHARLADRFLKSCSASSPKRMPISSKNRLTT